MTTTVDSLTQQEETAPEVSGDAASTAANATAPDATESDDTKSDDAKSGTTDAETTDTEKPKRGRPKAASARKTRTVELTITVTGTADGDWQAELKQGSKWIARGLDVPAAAVSRAAKELHADLSDHIDEVINAAREQQQAKVEQLEAELARAKQALAELEN